MAIIVSMDSASTEHVPRCHDEENSPSPLIIIEDDEDSQQQLLIFSADKSGQPSSDSESRFAQIPSEIIHQILSYLSARDLARVSVTCRTLAEHGSNELLWADIVNSHLPRKISDPGPFESFRKLYIAHHPCWFIPQNKIWFSDAEHTGNLILARYDNRRGVIEAYRILADRPSHGFQIWEWNPDVLIPKFDPKVSLWLDDPVILLKGRAAPSLSPSLSPWRARPAEIRMPMAVESQNIFNTLQLCAKPDHPNYYRIKPENQWPPEIIPTDARVYRDPERHYTLWDKPPQSLEQISESAFRIRRWVHFGMPFTAFTVGSSETLTTYATLDQSLYTPTREKPYQGIWVGDYSAHGCEFLLILQSEHGTRSVRSLTNARTLSEASEESPLDESSSENEVNGEGAEPTEGEVIHRGSLEGIKLTGDPNVPRGELSFFAKDIGRHGLVRIADDDLFRGARVVRSKGHVAGLGFRDDVFIESQLILISTDCIAHYWEAMGHVSYLRRVNIDELLQS